MRPVRAAQRGLTLIELMVALVLFATVGVLTWQASSRMADGRAHIGAELERWRTISRALHRVELELLQIAPPQLGAAVGGEAVLTLTRTGDTDGAGSGASLLRLALVDSGGDGPQRCGFRFADGRFAWLVWPDRRGDGTPDARILLDAVAALRWRFLSQGEWQDAWPADGSASGTAALPDAIALELELTDAGTLTRVFALR